MKTNSSISPARRSHPTKRIIRYFSPSPTKSIFIIIYLISSVKSRRELYSTVTLSRAHIKDLTCDVSVYAERCHRMFSHHRSRSISPSSFPSTKCTPFYVVFNLPPVREFWFQQKLAIIWKNTKYNQKSKYISVKFISFYGSVVSYFIVRGCVFR